MKDQCSKKSETYDVCDAWYSNVADPNVPLITWETREGLIESLPHG